EIWNACQKLSSNDMVVEEEGEIDECIIIDVVGVGKSVERGTGSDAKDGIMGKGGMIY
ncbi:hypothetical protein KI387_011481, partial [Taxus chinensis]